MIIILKNILINIIWQFMFDIISRVEFRVLIITFIVHLRTMSTIEIWRLFWYFIFNRITDNRLLITIRAQPAINTGILLDTKNKKFVWLSLIFTIIVYRRLTL